MILKDRDRSLHLIDELCRKYFKSSTLIEVKNALKDVRKGMKAGRVGREVGRAMRAGQADRM
jgi:hypothetical protein